MQLLYVSIIHLRLAWYSNSQNQFEIKSDVPVSIIIAARNESENLFKNLPFILEQDYENFEVIVVNNQSLDDSNWLLRAFCRQYKHLRVIEIKKNKHLKPGKKFPITMGIKGAKYEHLLFTDADCKPSSNQWIKEMTRGFVNKNQVVLGYGPHSNNQSFVNRFFRFDTAWIAMNYFSFCLIKIPYMGVGRNMAYTKSAFHSVKGFKSHYSIVSGDDDLFIQEVSKKSKCTVQINKNTHCYSPSADSIKNWIRQKRRHHSTSKKYNLFKKTLLGIYPISLILMLICFVYLCLVGYNWFLTLVILTALIAIKWIIQGICLLKLEERKFIAFLPIWDFVYSLIMPFVFLITRRKEVQKW